MHTVILRTTVLLHHAMIIAGNTIGKGRAVP